MYGDKFLERSCSQKRMVATKQVVQVQRNQNLSGLARPRVVWDMTFAARGVTGTRVHTQILYQTLAAHPAWDFQQICDVRENKMGKLQAGAQSFKWLWSGMESTLRKMKPDLLHVAAYLGPRRAPCPMIVNVFDTTFRTYPRDFDWKWRLYARTVIPSTVKRAAAIITDSEIMRADIVRAYHVPPERVYVIPPGVGAEFQPNADASAIAAMRARYVLPRDYLLYVGEKHPRKNLPALLEAFARVRGDFPELELVVVGPRSANREFQRAVKNFQIENAVRELGYVPSSDLPSLYAGARAFVYASKLEGFGMPPVEAMACGVPVVAMPNPPLPDVLGDAAYFSDDSTPEALVQAITRVLNDNALANELRARGFERAKRYTWQDAARKTIQVYENVLRNRMN